jgi:hypothetical protein
VLYFSAQTIVRTVLFVQHADFQLNEDAISSFCKGAIGGISALALDEDAHCALENDGGVASYREGNSFSSAQPSEHLSGSLGVTVGNKFLSANVTGSYNTSIQQNFSVCINLPPLYASTNGA